MISAMRTTVLIAMLASTSTALAEVPRWSNEANAETCAASFPERLADFRQAIPAFEEYRADYDRVMPWFYEHCRWLTDLEIAIRKIDDAAAFVCDTRKGRPRGLTAEFALDHSYPVNSPVLFVEHREPNDWCSAFDAQDRVSLAMSQFDAPLNTLRIVVEGMCWRVESKRCAQQRAALPPLIERLEATP